MLYFYLGLLILLTTVFCELAARRGWLPYWVSRKVLHVVAVGSCAVAGYQAGPVGERGLLVGIVAVAEVALIGLVGFGGLMREESGRRAWGIVWFPLAFLLLLLTAEADTIGFAMAVLAVCDPAATVAGKLYAGQIETDRPLDDELVRPPTPPPGVYTLTGDPKSWVGSLAFVGAFVVMYTLDLYRSLIQFGFEDGFFQFMFDPAFLLDILALGVVYAAGEALGSRGLDNLIVPLMVTVVGTAIIPTAPNFVFPSLIVLAVSFVWGTVRRSSLTLGGAVTAALMGVVIVRTVGLKWILPLTLFFLSSSLIGRLFPAPARAGDAKHRQPRDHWQVLANGGVFLTLALLWGLRDRGALELPVPFPGMLLIAAAVAMADTWSSELGQYFARPTYDVFQLRRVPVGLSGGMSVPGSLAGAVGAFLISLLGYLVVPGYRTSDLIMITLFGFFGMVADSFLGGTFQAAYRDPATGALSDVQGPNGVLHRGYPWMTNDLVNFLAILLTVGLFAAGVVSGQGGGR